MDSLGQNFESLDGVVGLVDEVLPVQGHPSEFVHAFGDDVGEFDQMGKEEGADFELDGTDHRQEVFDQELYQNAIELTNMRLRRVLPGDDP